jgi:HK97 gp10 family phage protein
VTHVVLNHAAIADLARSEGVEHALLRVGEKVAERAATTAPRDTGAGAESIHAELVDGEVRVGPDAEHFYMTAFVEVGTSKMGARPFLRPALDASYDV